MASDDDDLSEKLSAHLSDSGLLGEPDELIARFYADLRRCAAGIMRDERSDHTLQPTALVNEAYPKLAAIHMEFRNKDHFLAVAVKTMRQVLCDHARAHRTAKRGSGGQKVPVDGLNLGYEDRKAEEVLAYDEALSRVPAGHDRQIRAFELQYFMGFEVSEIAKEIGISRATAVADLRMAKALLREALSERAV